MRVALALALLELALLALLDPYERERLALLRAALLPRPPPLELAAAATTADGVVGAVAPGVAAPVLPREADRPPLAPPPLLRLPLRLRLSRPPLVLPSPSAPLPPAPLPALLRWLLWLFESASYMEYVKKVGCSTALVLPLALPLLLWPWSWPCLWLR